MKTPPFGLFERILSVVTQTFATANKTLNKFQAKWHSPTFWTEIGVQSFSRQLANYCANICRALVRVVLFTCSNSLNRQNV